MTHTINSLEIAIYNLFSSQASLSQALSSLVLVNIFAWLNSPKHISNYPEHSNKQKLLISLEMKYKTIS